MNKQLYEKEDNINKPFFPVVRLEDIIDTISEKSIKWILNNYNHIYVEWKNDVVGTRLSVPTILRRNGLWITYNNGGRLITEYYIGKNTEIKDKHWKDDDNWEDYTNKLIDGTVEYRHLSESLKQLFNKGNITNFPDEEDLTSDGVALFFKDREYQPENFIGLGRVILRKNIVKVGEEYKNILTQSMINKENTIYEIRYDFDLNGQEITIPEDCILDFQGGKLFNGALKGNNTNIKAEAYQIFKLNLDLKGTFNVKYIFSEWYGAKGDGINDDSYAINKALVSPITTLKLLSKIYNVLDTTDIIYDIDNSIRKANIIVPNNKIIIGTSTSDYTNNCTISVSENANSDFGLFISGRQVKLEGIRVISNKNSNNIYSCKSLIVTQKGVSHLTFNQIHARFCNNNAMDIDCYGLIFNLCSAGDCGGVAYYLHGTDGNNTSATLISCAAGGSKSHGYLLHKMTYCSLLSCSADTCGFDSISLDIDNIKHAYHIMECRFISMLNCGCEGCYKSIKTSRDTRGLSVISCDFLLFEESKYPVNFDYNDIISLDFTEASKFVNTNIGRRFSNNNLITATYSARVVFENCFLQKANDSGKDGFLGHSNIKYPDGDGYKNIIIFNNIGQVNIEAYVENLSIYNNTIIQDFVEVKIGDNEMSNIQYENITGKAILSSKANNSICSIISNNVIKNCTNLIFKNLTFNFNTFSGDSGFVIYDSVVIFNNISFISYHNFETKKLLSITNSKIIFKNCKTIAGYNSSKFIKDVMNIDDHSIIEFIDKDCGTTEERNAFTPLYKGFEWFDTDLSKPTYYNGNKWVDATGAEV